MNLISATTCRSFKFLIFLWFLFLIYLYYPLIFKLCDLRIGSAVARPSSEHNLKISRCQSLLLGAALYDDGIYFFRSLFSIREFSNWFSRNLTFSESDIFSYEDGDKWDFLPLFSTTNPLYPYCSIFLATYSKFSQIFLHQLNLYLNHF